MPTCVCRDTRSKGTRVRMPNPHHAADRSRGSPWSQGICPPTLVGIESCSMWDGDRGSEGGHNRRKQLKTQEVSQYDCCWAGSHSGTQCMPMSCPSLSSWVLRTASFFGWFTFLPNHCSGRTGLENLSSQQGRSPTQGYPDQGK